MLPAGALAANLACCVQNVSVRDQNCPLAPNAGETYELLLTAFDGSAAIRAIGQRRGAVYLRLNGERKVKRSEINAAIKRMEALMAKYSFVLPPFLYWTTEEWRQKGHEYDEIRDNCLGWDVTDFGRGDFSKLGIALITIRNGNVGRKTYPKPYAEKVIMIEEGQVCPMHFHWQKMEDIINRGGGNIIFNLYNATKNGEAADADVEVNQDGRRYAVRAGEDILLRRGESLSLRPGCYHAFHVQPGTGAVLLGEVSMCNDDMNDNRFLDESPRFPQIEEDEKPYRFLCTEYPAAP
jgi:hypothetical protein